MKIKIKKGNPKITMPKNSSKIILLFASNFEHRLKKETKNYQKNCKK
jgi:hypothetical protein